MSKKPVSELKSILGQHNLETSGRKNSLLNRIIDNIPKDEIPINRIYYSKSQLGQNLIDSNIENIKLTENCNGYNELPYKDTLFSLICNKQYEKIIELQKENNFTSLSIIHQKEINGFHAFSNFTLEIPAEYREKEQVIKNCIIYCRILGLRFETSVHVCFDLSKILLTFNQVHKLMRTLSSLIELLVYKKIGISEYYKIICSNDNRSCSNCKNFKNIKLPVENAIIGVNFPPLDNCNSEYCRCFTSLDTDI